MRQTLFTLVAIFIIGAIVAPTFVKAEGDEATITMRPVSMMGETDPIEDAYSVLVRGDEEVSVMFHAAELTPGDTVTMWWVVFNNPEACSDPCNSDDLPQNDGDPEVEAAMIWGDGGVVDHEGRISLTSRLSVGDSSNAYVFETDGLTDLEGAEIHLVIRTHGEALDDLLEAQITTLNGGCDNGSETTGTPGPNTCSNVMASIHIAGE